MDYVITSVKHVQDLLHLVTHVLILIEIKIIIVNVKIHFMMMG